MKTYTELSKFKSYDDRFKYLKLDGEVGSETFGYDRYLNQALYKCPEWKRVRDKVIIRDNGCDLGVEGYEIFGRPIVHHMNPISIEQVERRDPDIFNPEYLITTVLDTHNAIHYSDESILDGKKVIERKPNDTIPWR